MHGASHIKIKKMSSVEKKYCGEKWKFLYKRLEVRRKRRAGSLWAWCKNGGGKIARKCAAVLIMRWKRRNTHIGCVVNGKAFTVQAEGGSL